MAYHADHQWEDCPEKDEWIQAAEGRWSKHGHPPPPHLKGMDGAREFTSNAEAAEYMQAHYGKVGYTPEEIDALKHLDAVNAWLRSGREGPQARTTERPRGAVPPKRSGQRYGREVEKGEQDAVGVLGGADRGRYVGR